MMLDGNGSAIAVPAAVESIRYPGGMDSVLTRPQLNRWRVAVFAIFAASGLSLATWASRVPAIKSTLGIGNAEVGLLLLFAGIASITGLSLSSFLLARFGPRRSILGAMIAYAVGVAVIGVGVDVLGSYGVVLAGLVLFGVGNGSVDVMMNVEGAAIEKRFGKTLLPLFHAFFSFGTVLGAGFGALAVIAGLNVLAHTAIVTVLILIVAFVAIANVPRHEPATDPEAPSGTWRDRLAVSLSAWKEPRTYTLGIVMLGMAFAEGSANDWLALGVVDGHGGSEALGAAALAVFSVAMTGTRVLGGPLVDRFGRVMTLRVLAVTAAAGLLLFVFASNLPLVFAGALLWGVGASMGFPLGMSAAADDPARAAGRVAAASTIGYIAFLAGPPLLGLISEHIGLLSTLLIVVALVITSGLASSAARPLPGAHVGEGHPRP
jgi:fucose permease